MKKEKRFTGYDADKKSELDLRSVLLVFGAVIALVWTLKIRFPLGIVIAFVLCVWVACVLGYTYGTISIDTDGIHYRNAFFVKKVLYWKDIGKVYKTESFIGRGMSIYVICCTVGNKRQKTDFSFDIAMFREKSYFMIGYTEERMKEIYANCLRCNSV